MRLVSFAFAGVDPELMGVGPIPATEKALAKAGLSIGDIGAFEINEAFAVQVLAFCDHFELAADDPRLNPYGGAIALGHPLASSGVRLMIHLARAFREHPEVRYGLTTLCIGLGMGGTVIWENLYLLGGQSEGRRTRTADRAASAGSEGEVVTRALSRDIKLPHTAGTAVLITLDNGRDHTRPNTLGAQGLAQLNRALDTALAREDIVAIAITGKPFILAAGADLSAFAKIVHRDRALAIARIGHAVFDKLHTSQVPTFAFINGVALGGGLELTLHCLPNRLLRRLRDRSTRVFLGPSPGLGRRVLGPQPDRCRPGRAADHRESTQPEQDAEWRPGVRARPGRRDFRQADFLARSLDWAGQIVAGSLTINRPEVDRGEPGMRRWREAQLR